MVLGAIGVVRPGEHGEVGLGPRTRRQPDRFLHAQQVAVAELPREEAGQRVEGGRVK
jgi:hypothetical protein